MAKWVGYAVSVNCGEPLGCYQGTIVAADGSTITLNKAFRNGFPYPKSQVTLNAADIKDLKIIEVRPEPSEQTHSTVAVTKNTKKAQKATVCDNLQANPSSSGAAAGGGAAAVGKVATGARSKPIDIQGIRAAKNNNHAGSWGAGAARRRNEACFGDAADPALADDFDFEGNLALFDKRALFERMRAAPRPDLVRQADELGRFRHDENVLGAPPPPRRALVVPDDLRGPLDYVTDEGLAVPSVAPHLRRALWDGLRRAGLLEVSHALLARAAADVALRLAGGGRRLEPRNAHQAPVAVALVGAHDAGAAGLLVARLLASHGARAVALLVPPPLPALTHAPRRESGRPPPLSASSSEALRREKAAAAPAGVALADSTDALPAADVVLLALHDPLWEEDEAHYAAALRWAGASRAACVALEPPERGWEGVAARAAVVGVAPPALAPRLGRVFLADVAPPPTLFASLGVLYRPPFGASSLLALHPADD